MVKEYRMIDLFKFVFSICIVGIHTSLLDVDNSTTAWLVSSVIFRSGVPFFFIVSGFFLAEKIYKFDSTEVAAIRCVKKKYCFKLFPPLIVWGGWTSVRCL